MKLARIILAALALAMCSPAQAQTLGSVTTAGGNWPTVLAPDINDDFTKIYGTPVLTIGNQTTWSTERGLAVAGCVSGTDGGAGSSYTLNLVAACIDAALLGTDSVSADELNATGVESELEAVIEVGDLQGSLTLAGDVDGAHGSNDLDEAAVETELEAVLDLPQMQGEITAANIAADAVEASEIVAGAVGTSEAAALDAGDTTTGTFGDARVDGSLEADELVLAGDVDGTANANDLDEAAVETELEAVLDLPQMQGEVTAANIAADAVEASEIAAGAVGTSEAAALDTADVTTGTWADARVDGSLEADEVNPTLGSQTQGNYVDDVTAGTGIAVTHTPGEGSDPAVALDYSDAGASPALSADQCRFTSNATTSGFIVCEGDTADAFETRWHVVDPTADRLITSPNADSVTVQPNTCSGTDKVTGVSALGVVSCAADEGGAGSGDNIRVEDSDNGGTYTAAADADLEDSGDIDFVLNAATSPDEISALVRPNSVALTTDTTGNYAAGDAEAGAALTGDTATGFFSAGTLELARGGTGASLADPGADRFMFWDDSAGAVDWLTPASPITITTTTVDIAAATESADGSCELATTAEVETGTDTTRCVTAAGVFAAISGKHSIYIPAGAMMTETTTGCAAGSTETATNLVMVPTKDCDGATQEGVQFSFGMPKSADESTVTMRMDWTAASGSGNVLWLFSCLARSNDDPLDTAFGTEISVTDTLLAALDVHQAPESAAITAGGTPAENDNWFCRAQRDADAAGDTLNAVDAKIIGVRVLYGINAPTDD